MAVVKLRVLLFYLALCGATGETSVTEPNDLGTTQHVNYRVKNVTRDFVILLINCICQRNTANCNDPATYSTISNMNISTDEPLTTCQIQLQGLISCREETMLNDICTFQCDLNDSSNPDSSLNITWNSNQNITFNFQDPAEACSILFTSTTSSSVPTLDIVPTLDDVTTTNIPTTSATVNRTTYYYESEKLSSGSIAGIAVGVTLTVAALVCIVVGYLLCRRRYQSVTKKIPIPPAKSYLHNESIKRFEDRCIYGNVDSISAKDVEKNASMAGVYSNQVIGPNNNSVVVDATDGGDGLEYEDISGLKSIHGDPGFLQGLSTKGRNRYNTSEMSSTYSNVPENYAVLDACFTNDVGEDYVELSSENSVQVPVSTDLRINKTLPFKPTLCLHINTSDSIEYSSVSVIDESSLPASDSKKESVYFELEKVSDDEDENVGKENEIGVYSNI